VGWVKEVITKPLRNLPWRTELARTVVTKSRYGEQTSRRGDGPQPPALGLVDVPEKSNGLPRDVDSTPDVHFKHLPCLFLWGGLQFTHHREPGIVVNDVNATESDFCGPESVFDIIGAGHIDLEDQELALCPRLEELLKRFRLSHSGDNDVTLFQHVRGEG